jgi:hypothetical protein
MNLFGLPHDVVGRVTRQVSWWREGGRGDGTIATLAFRGVTGRRFPPEMLGPPRLGLFLIAIQVDDAAERCGRLARLGRALSGQPLSSIGPAPDLKQAAPLPPPAAAGWSSTMSAESLGRPRKVERKLRALEASGRNGRKEPTLRSMRQFKR